MAGGARPGSGAGAGWRGLEDVGIGESVLILEEIDGRILDHDRLHVDLAPEEVSLR